MQTVEQYRTTATLFSREGGVWRYPSISAAVRDLGLNWIGRYVGDHFRIYSHSNWRTADGGYYRRSTDEFAYVERVYKEAQFILRDDFGRPITYAACWAAVRKPLRAVRPKRSSTGPVEGTGKRRKRYHRRRQARFINAVRAAETFREEGEVAVRHARGVELLQSKWDADYWRGFHQERSWKKFRKTQWK